MDMTERPNHVAEAMESAVPVDAVKTVDMLNKAETGDTQLVDPDVSHTLKVVRFEALARCGDEIWIENEGQIYRLRRTRQGKLILTK